MEEKNKNIENLKRLVGACPTCNRRPAALIIQRIPENTQDAFKKLSNDEFKGDYGFTLKHLVDFYNGLIPTGWEHLEVALDELNERLRNVEEQNSTKKEEKKYKVMANGKRIEC